MNYRYLLFDLDGTISDPKDGIVNCLNHALDHHDYPTRSADELAQYIGPPLDYTFGQLTGVHDRVLVDKLVLTYRERYGDIGFRENTIYPGMREVLLKLHAQPGLTLGLCTSKRADFAAQILDLFELSMYFSFLSGGDVGVEKEAQISALLADNTIDSCSLMIGDRHFDISAAKQNALDVAAVTWGYGSLQELQEAGADIVVNKPVDLLTLVS